jgi:excisionase family DNA binding protein
MLKDQESGRKSQRAPDRRARMDRRCGNGRRRIDQDSYYETKPVLNASEACRYMGISRPTFLKLVNQGRFRAQKLGRGWKILKSEIDRFLLGG